MNSVRHEISKHFLGGYLKDKIKEPQTGRTGTLDT
jgi:hypothetical protein